MLVDQVLERELQEELDEAERLLTSEETDEEMPAVGVTAAAVSEPEIIVLDEAMPGVVVDRSGNTHSAGPVAIAGPSRAATAQRQVPVIDIGSVIKSTIPVIKTMLLSTSYFYLVSSDLPQ